MAARDQPAISGERDAPTDRGRAFGHEPVPFTIRADAEQFVVHQLLDRECVVHVDQV
jgi:hypothetical protein